MGDLSSRRRLYALAVPYVCAILAAVVAIIICTMSQRSMERRLDRQQRQLAEQQEQLAEQSRVTGLVLCFVASEVKPADGPKAAELVQLIRDTYHC